MIVNYRVISKTLKNLNMGFLVLFEFKKNSASEGEKTCNSICAFGIKEQKILHSERYVQF